MAIKSIKDDSLKGFKDLMRHTEKLERDNAKLKESNKALHYNMQKLKQQLDRAQLSAINKDELDKLRLKNDKLMVKINQLRRMEDKFNQILEITNGYRKTSDLEKFMNELDD